MDALVGEVVFAVGDTKYRVDDVVRAARHWGDLSALDAEVREGIACVKCAAETDRAPTAEELEEAAAEFRYARDLITAEETETWLERWELTVESWTEYLERALLRGRWASELEDIVSHYPVTREEIDRTLHAEAICSGRFGRVAHKLAGRVAAYEQAREEGWAPDQRVADDPASSLPGLEAAFQWFRDRALTPAAVTAEIASHHLDWICVDCQWVAFPDIQGAREAALCVREDGRELTDVAVDARADVGRARLYLDEVEPGWRDHLVSASTGDLLGPLAADTGFALVLVGEKVLPSPDDVGVRRRAEAALVERALELEISHRVTWHSLP
jgi:hypothetical protein